MEKIKYTLSPSDLKGQFVNLRFKLDSDVDNIGIDELMYESNIKPLEPVIYKDNRVLSVLVDAMLYVNDELRLVLVANELNRLFKVGDRVVINGVRTFVTQVNNEYVTINDANLADVTTFKDTYITKSEVDLQIPDLTINYNKMVSGVTTSKYTYLKNSFKGGIVVENSRVKLKGINDYGIINEVNKNFTRYTLFLDSKQPIEYIDFLNGRTTFNYTINEEVRYDLSSDIYFTKYKNIVEEPKITSDVFINRGVNSVFDGIKRLRTINGLAELEKTGLNYYKINIKGEKF